MCAVQSLNSHSPSPPIKAPNVQKTFISSDSKSSLLSEVSETYRKKIRDPKTTRILEPDAFPKIPALTNILYVPTDTYYATKSLIQSVRERDMEGAQDSVAALLAIPMNIGNSIGTFFDYGIGLHFLPASLSVLLKPTYIFGLVLCTIEGIIDSFGLHRQGKFSREFDFKLVKNLKILLDSPNAKDGYRAFMRVLTLVEEKRPLVEQLYGQEETEAFFGYLETLKAELDARPHFRALILKDHEPQIRELTQVILAKNLLHFQEEYLQLNPDEVKAIGQKVEKKYADLPVEKQREKLLIQMDTALNKKHRSLARRIRPWLAHEADDTTHAILMGLTSEKVENRDLAIKEGLSLMEEVRIQNLKKTIVHVIGILSFAIAAASLVALLAGAPYIVPVLLMTVGTVVGAGRFIMFAGSLDVRGWDFSLKDLVPDFIRKRIFGDLSLSHPKMLMQHKVTPLTEIYEPPISSTRS